jgi:hypothetical protein
MFCLATAKRLWQVDERIVLVHRCNNTISSFQNGEDSAIFQTRNVACGCPARKNNDVASTQLFVASTRDWCYHYCPEAAVRA